MEVIDHPAPAMPAAAQQEFGGNEFLVFSLGREEYGVNIQQVQELRNYEAVTAIANAPAYLKGVINLRGLIVPIIDLRIKFSRSMPSYDAFTVVIILTLGTRMVGMVVDGVSDVLALSAEHIKPAPAAVGAALDANCLTGIGTIDNRMLILVDVERLVGGGAPPPPELLAA